MNTFGIIDAHSHILPQMDDGSRTVEESVAMLQLEQEQGVPCVLATPHFYADTDTPERFLERRRRAEAMLRQELSRRSGLPDFRVGAEVHYFAGISSCDALQDLTVEGTKFLLLEMPWADWTESMYQEISWIYTRQGLVPILAHLDRYLHPFRTRCMLQRIAETPALVQVNAEFFLHRRTSGLALKLLRKQKLHFLGSECHNMQSRRPNLGLALARIQEKQGSESISWLAEQSAMLF